MTATAKKEKKVSKFMEPLEVSPALFAIVKEKKMPRTQVQKKLWEYIKKHDLQNPKNRREILPDAALGAVLGSKPVSMFEMTRLVNKHLKSPS